MNEIIDRIRHNSVNLIAPELERQLNDGRRLRIKFGADPTGAELHLGHAVALRKLRTLQDLGHQVILIIGDFTATIGDPSGRNEARPPLTLEETRQNGETYLEQARLILRDDPESLQVEHNSSWLCTLGYAEVISLCSRVTVSQILARSDFAARFEAELPISLHELLYPITQGQDSVAINCDMEVGGVDQLFNLLMGRHLQEMNGQTPQSVLTMPLLIGLDGKDKMSKSKGNFIGLTESPESMFEKLMKVPDSLLEEYLRLLTDLSEAEIEQTMALHPVEAHENLAELIINWLHPQANVEAARQRFRTVARGGIPENIREFSVGSQPIRLAELLVNTQLASSLSEARRLISQRGIKLNSQTVSDPQLCVDMGAMTEGVILQRGKNLFARVTR